MDKKPVHILTSLSTFMGSCKRSIADPGRTNYRSKIFPQPTIIAAYNSGMGATDSFNHRIALYRPHIKTKTWKHRIFLHLLNASVVNAYVLWKITKKIRKSYPLLLYIRHLIKELTKDHLDYLKTVKVTKQPRNTNTKTPTQWSSVKSRLAGSHSPRIHWCPKTRKDNKGSENIKRSRCIICSTRVGSLCMDCGVYICISAAGDNLSCWDQFHTCDTLDNAKKGY